MFGMSIKHLKKMSCSTEKHAGFCFFVPDCSGSCYSRNFCRSRLF